MAEQDLQAMEAQVGEAPADPWAVAFAALDQKDEAPAEAAADADGGDVGDVPGADQADPGEGAAAPAGDDGAVPEAAPGGPGDTAGEGGGQDAPADEDDIGLTPEEVSAYRESFMEDIRSRTIRDVAQAYIRKGARNTNGVLGATINDPDICKRDERDGMPRFYNPETGREFTGDNPRAQAQEWVDSYNRELADAYNKTCAEYSKQLMDKEGGRLAVIEFAPKYRALDPVRQAMLDSLLEDYEVTDENGDVVSYSCDLDKALAAVNRQVQVIQARYGQQAAAQQPKPAEPSGPALDTPSTTGAQPGGRPQFKSLEEAMEWEQDQALARMREKGRR